MFKCCECKQSVKKMNKVIVEKRPQTYYTILVQHNKYKGKRKYIHYRKKEDVDVAILKKEEWSIKKEIRAKGWEIAKEINLCDKCYRKRHG